jgi:hypothetical protein
MFTIRLRCLDAERAARFAEFLRDNDVDVAGVELRDVLIPTTHPPYVWVVAEAAVKHGFAADDEATRVARAFLAGSGYGG